MCLQSNLQTQGLFLLHRQHINALKPRHNAAAESPLNRLRRQHITVPKARKAKQSHRGREICAYSAKFKVRRPNSPAAGGKYTLIQQSSKCAGQTAQPRAGNTRLFSGGYAVQTYNSTAARRLAPTQNKSRALRAHKAQRALLVYAFKRRWSKCLSLSPQARREAPSRCRAR